ncbi:MAG TPA: cohesin domain-containing protein [candidate division Zixibacteria bacterium]|nr:cohesin domain-containing protein [candidate division Zixibacteria bacterium]
MNTKTLKTKPIVALAVAILIVMPMLLATMTIVKADNNTPVLSVVLSGTTTTTLIPAHSVGTTFSADVRVDNTSSVSPGINGYSYGLTWNPAVLSVTNVNDAFSGSFLNSGANQGTVQSLGDLPQDNSNGLLIIGDIILNTAKPAAAATGSGVLTTVTFTVLAAGQSNINLRPSDVGVAYLSYPDNQGNSHDVVATTVNAQYNTVTSISLYQSGSSNPAVQAKLINSNISVDIFVSNPFAGNFWGWNVGVSWDPTVLQLETVSEGTYLNPTPGAGGSPTLFITGHVDNQKGTIQQGISDIYLSNITTAATTGVLATITFQVIKLANGSTINLAAGIPTLTDNHSNSISCTLINATVIAHGAASIPGDLNGDGKVDLKDLVIFARAYGSKPGDSNWNPVADILGHGKVDLADLVTLAQHYGQHV